MTPEFYNKFVSDSIKNIDKFEIILDKSSLEKLKIYLESKHNSFNGFKITKIDFVEKKHLSMLGIFRIFVEVYTNSFRVDEVTYLDFNIWCDFVSVLDMKLIIKIIGNIGDKND